MITVRISNNRVTAKIIAVKGAVRNKIMTMRVMRMMIGRMRKREKRKKMKRKSK